MDALAVRFEENRGRLRAIAHRMLGSAAEAEDAVQEAWLRLSRTDPATVDNLHAWLTTVVSRVCLDVLRSRRSRSETLVADPVEADDSGIDPMEEALLAESVSRALLVVLGTLTPAERIAFVLHDLFAMPFADIAPIVDRTPVATKKLASRARQRVRGTPDVPPPSELTDHRELVAAFLAAARDGDLTGLLAVLTPEAVRRADPAVLPAGAPRELQGAREVAAEIRLLGNRARYAEPALVNGSVGAVVAPGGHLQLAITFTFDDNRIAGFEVIADPHHLHDLTLATLPAHDDHSRHPR